MTKDVLGFPRSIGDYLPEKLSDSTVPAVVLRAALLYCPLSQLNPGGLISLLEQLSSPNDSNLLMTEIRLREFDWRCPLGNVTKRFTIENHDRAVHSFSQNCIHERMGVRVLPPLIGEQVWHTLAKLPSYPPPLTNYHVNPPAN